MRKVRIKSPGYLVRLLGSAVGGVILIVLVACGSPVVDDDASPGAASSGSPSPEPSALASLSPEPSPSASPPVVREQPAPVAAPGLLKVGPAGTALASAPAGAPRGRLRAGVLVPVTELRDGWAQITTPCSLSRWMPVSEGMGLANPQVVLDPGHGGGETGAVGKGGLQEKFINLDVSNRAADVLAAGGVSALLTRTDDYRATLGFRVAVAKAVKPALLVSVHHNADPDGPLPKPGTETYYQFRSADSKRLSGLIYEEVVKDLAPLGTQFVGDRDAGAKWRLNTRGGDYYGILRQAGEAGVTAVLSELAFVSNPAEEALLNREDVRAIEAGGLARGISRYLSSGDPGSGFTTPYPREAPAGPGGGADGCVDPS